MAKKSTAKEERIEEPRRVVRFPITKFCKPGYEVSEETNEESVQIKIKIPSSHCSGDSAIDFFGKKRLRLRFSRRGVGEWGQDQIIEDGPGQIFDCEVEVPSFSWRGGNWQFDFWTDKISFEQAKAMYRKAGSIEVEVLGEPVEVGSSPSAAKNGSAKKPKGKGAKKKAEPTATIPGTTPEELAENHSVSITNKYRVDIKVVALPEGQFSCLWSGEGPAGGCEQGEPSIRKSANNAASASIGNAVDFWTTYSSDDEAKAVIQDLRNWLKDLEDGRTPAAIEAERAEGIEGEEEADDE